MLFLLFRIGSDSFALGTDGVVEVVPLADLERVRQAPSGVAGSLEYRGRFIPVVDLSLIETGMPAQRRLSTRIIVMRHPDDESALIGLLVESATETLRLDPAQFAPFAPGPYGLVQRIDLREVLRPAVLAFLSEQAVEP